MDFTSGKGQEPRTYLEAPERPDDDAAMPVLVDFMVFKKDFAKHPSYWVELCYAPKPKMWFIRRRWEFTKADGNHIEGYTESNTTGSDKEIVNIYRTTIQLVIKKKYEIVSRKMFDWSPAYFVNLGLPIDTDVSTTPNLRSVMKRKPQTEWM